MTAPAPPAANGGFAVTLTDLYRVADGFALTQGWQLDKAAKDLVKALREHPDAGGNGDAPKAFAAAYVRVGNRFLEVWAKSVVSVGGAATGFVVTANNYARADAATSPSGVQQAQQRPLPQVLSQAGYQSVPNLQWGEVHDGGEDFIRSLFEHIPGWARGVLHPLVKHAFNMGKASDVYPFAHQHHLNDLSHAWRDASMAIVGVENTLTGLMSSITSQPNNDWYNAMRQFCSSLWGSTAWGHSPGVAGYQWAHDSATSPTSSHPVITVLFDTAQKIAALLYQMAEAAVDLNHGIHEVFMDALRDALPKVKVNLHDGLDMSDVKGVVKGLFGAAKKSMVQLGAGIVLNVDKARADGIVDTFNGRIRALVPQLDALMPALDEAFLSAPTFNAEEARAEAFGSRALQDFAQNRYLYTVLGQDPRGLYYPVDLASQEFIRNGHTIDKHVGLTDEQLAQRIRDQGTASASTFTDMASAQLFTQNALNDDTNAIKISAWLQNVEKHIKNDPNWDWTNSELHVPYDCHTTTGHSVTKDPVTGALTPPTPTQRVLVRLVYNKGGDPPYIVLTSYPQL